MNDLLDHELTQKLAEHLGVAADFVVAAIWERVYFGAVWAGVWCLVAVALAATGWWLAKKLETARLSQAQERLERYSWQDELDIWGTPIGPGVEIVKVLAILVPGMLFLKSLRTIILVLTAPNYVFLYRLGRILEQFT